MQEPPSSDPSAQTRMSQFAERRDLAMLRPHMEGAADPFDSLFQWEEVIGILRTRPELTPKVLNGLIEYRADNGDYEPFTDVMVQNLAEVAFADGQNSLDRLAELLTSDLENMDPEVLEKYGKPYLSMIDELVSTGDRSLARSKVSLDSGIQLLQPVQKAEFGNLELILQEVWKAIENESLTIPQQEQIRAMGKALDRQTKEIEIDQTPRWKLVGALRSSLRFIAIDAPQGLVAWGVVISTLKAMNYHELASELAEAVGALA